MPSFQLAMVLMTALMAKSKTALMTVLMAKSQFLL